MTITKLEYNFIMTDVGKRRELNTMKPSASTPNMPTPTITVVSPIMTSVSTSGPLKTTTRPYASTRRIPRPTTTVVSPMPTSVSTGGLSRITMKPSGSILS